MEIIKICEGCNYSKIEKSLAYGDKRYYEIDNLYCTKLNKNVYTYLDYEGIAVAPKECPLTLD